MRDSAVFVASQRLCYWFSRHFVERPIGWAAAPKRRGRYNVEQLIAEHGGGIYGFNFR
jgi:hypothetical protein